MTLRSRLTLAGGGAVFIALTVGSLVIFFAVRAKLHDQIDISLIQSAADVSAKVANAGPKLGTGKTLPAGSYEKGSNPKFPAGPYLGVNGSGYFQIVPSLGAASKPAGPRPVTSLPAQTTSTTSLPGGSTVSLAQGATPPLIATVPPQGKPGSGKTRPNAKGEPAQKLPQPLSPNSFVPFGTVDGLVAGGLAPAYFSDVVYRGTPLRLYTARLGASGDGLVRAARPLTEANATLARVRWLLIGLTLGGAAAAALLGRFAAAAVLGPVRRLAGAVHEVTTTRDLKQRIPVSGSDEIGSLAENFNAMLAALDESLTTQQQLIADASHELRTPLTAHRANIELLSRPDLPPEGRTRALAAAVRGIDELSNLVSDLILAARNGKSVDARQPVRLDRLVESAVERARRRAPGLRFETALEPCTVSAAASRLERVVDNLLDNATKWSPDGATVEVSLSAGVLTVRDHGLGIEETDLPHVFDRFYRAAAARGLPGSGLGLSIVKQTVEDHGGSVSAGNADDGGAWVAVRLPLESQAARADTIRSVRARRVLRKL